MKFTQQTVEDLLTIWQNLSSDARDKVIGDALFPLEYSEKNPPRFSQNVKNGADTDRLSFKLSELGYVPIVIESLPRSTLSIVRCGDVCVPPMPSHKGIAFIGYCAAYLMSEDNADT